VDDILGQHQTVIKTFSQFHRDIAGFAGSTILGDGRVALIVDCAALIKSAQDQPAQLETSTVS
jgi:two-component system chemotaxis sensor kinase CheA